jgi:phosphate transport system permease protein
MPTWVVFSALVALTLAAYHLGRRRAFSVAQGGLLKMHSLPGYYGLHVAIWCGLPSLLVLAGWVFLETSVIIRLVVDGLPAELKALGPDRLNLLVNDIRNLVAGNIIAHEPDAALLAAAEQFRRLQTISRIAMAVAVLAIGLAAAALTLTRIRPQQRARNAVEAVITWVLIACSSVAILTTVGIVLSVLVEAISFFRLVPLGDFLFGLQWSPQIALRSDQVGSSGAFGAVPLFAGTLLITAIALFVAVPVGLLSAIYLSEYAPHRARSIAKPLLEVLAGVPTVVYGFFAALFVAPAIRTAGTVLGLDVASESALAAGLVMGMMMIPFISSLSDDVMNAVPQALRDGALAMGATRSETIRRVVLPAALPGIVGAILLAISFAIGETMIVVMAAGLAARLTANPLEAVTTVTVQIVTLLVGDQEFDSPKTLAAFALGLVLFIVTLALNVVALAIVRRYREQYE